MRYHSKFTIQPHYLNWVRLSWKFICISISSLAGEVWAEIEPLNVIHLCSAQDDWWSWLGGHAHRRGAYTRVCNWKVMIDYPHTNYDDSGISLMDVSNVVVKVYHLYRVSNYSNSRVRGYGQLEWPYYSVVKCFQKQLMKWMMNLDLTTTGLCLWIIASQLKWF